MLWDINHGGILYIMLTGIFSVWLTQRFCDQLVNGIIQQSQAAHVLVGYQQINSSVTLQQQLGSNPHTYSHLLISESLM